MPILITAIVLFAAVILAAFAAETVRNWHGYKTGYAEGYRAGLDHGRSKADLDQSRRDREAMDEAVELWGLGQ